MKIEKLPSGSYRARKMCKGTTYTITLSYKPTERELILLFAEKMQEDTIKTDGTFLHFANEYIEARSNILSPATIRTYNIKIGQLTDHFKALKMSDITPTDVQTEINSFSQKHSPKSVRTLHGFIASILGIYRPNLKLHTSLPMMIKKADFEPKTTDIKAILNRAKGTRYSIPFQLGVLGLRRGEICALELSDLEDNKLHITKDVVYNDGQWIVTDTPKTEASNRTIILPDSLVNEIKEAGCIYDGHPNGLNRAIKRYQKELGIEQFRFHSLRAYFASYAHALGISDQDIMSMGGWATDYVMKSVYRKTMEESRQKAMSELSQKILS